MCFNERKGPSSCVAIWSALSLIIGIVMGFFTFNWVMTLTRESIEQTSMSDAELVSQNTDNYTTVITYFLFVFAFTAILVGACGIAASQSTNRCCTVLTGCVTCPLQLLFIGLGLFLMAGSPVQNAIFAQGKSPTTKFCRQVELDMTDKYACEAGL